LATWEANWLQSAHLMFAAVVLEVDGVSQKSHPQVKIRSQIYPDSV